MSFLHLQIGISPLIIFLTLILFLHHPTLSTSHQPVNNLPQPDPARIQSFLPTSTIPTTIPASPEQSNLAGCPLDLPEELFEDITQACDGNNKVGHLSKSKCCPVLGAWVYSVFSSIALTRAGRMIQSSSHDLPIMPDDSEICVGSLVKALKGKGIELRKANESCDLVFCYCGIRLPSLSCNEAFSLSHTEKGKLVGDKSVKRLEKDCYNSNDNGGEGGGFSSVSRCSKCLNRLYQLNNDEKNGVSNKSRSSDRKNKIHGRECELMGLTWLLDKNRTTYMPAVTLVLRALMTSTNGSDPPSCSLTREGLPLAVDSAEINDKSSSIIVQSPTTLITLLLLFYIVFAILLVL